MVDELRSIRMSKIGKIKAADSVPYADRFEISHTIGQALKLENGSEAQIAGRLMSIRKFGKLIFAHIKDRSGAGQISFEKQSLPEKEWLLLNDATDIGDFIGVDGKVWTTKTGEKTLAVKKFSFLSKGIRPLPEKWHGLRDQELQYRKRYLDLLMNDETRLLFQTRTKVVQLIRQFLDEHDFVEVETPILQMASSGASARPFITYHNALQQNFYLRISPETYLKRLVVGGLERVYEIGKNFRNEGIDPSHLQEFTMLEWYCAYWNYRDNMKFIKELIIYVLNSLLGTTILNYRGQTLDFGAEWPEVEYTSAVEAATGIDVLKYDNRDKLAEDIENRLPNFEVEKYKSLPALIDVLYKQTVRPQLIQPCFLLHHPTVLVPLARRNDVDPRILDMFQVVVNSWEIVKAYSELVDPVDQRNRMLEQVKYRDQGDDETMMMEDDYIECMEYGMPPISGLGLGIDRLVALITNAESLRDVVFFPNLRFQTPLE